MPVPEESRREHPSTYFVEDRSNNEELKRLILQDHLLTTLMGGVLAEQPAPEKFQRVLDVGCGPGGWLIEVAKAYPDISLLIGVDTSGSILDYAREQARLQGVSERVEFHTMDALRMLEFPNAFFDLVNMRAGIGWLRTWDWPKVLQEFKRVTKPGGIVRVTEAESRAQASSSAAYMSLQKYGVEAIYRSGHAFAADGGGVTTEIPRLFREHGLQQIQTRLYEIEYRAGTPEGTLFIEDVTRLMRVVVPFIRKWSQVPDDYEETYQRMLVEMQDPDFRANWHLISVWGQVLTKWQAGSAR